MTPNSVFVKNMDVGTLFKLLSDVCGLGLFRGSGRPLCSWRHIRVSGGCRCSSVITVQQCTKRHDRQPQAGPDRPYSFCELSRLPDETVYELTFAVKVRLVISYVPLCHFC